MSGNNRWLAPLQDYAETVRSKFATFTSGEPEDQLRAPFEWLLSAVGKLSNISIVSVGETLLSSGLGRPDFGIECNGLLCGHLELKAPGKGADTSLYTGHDRKQWLRFAELPNVLYSDGQEFALYRKGTLAKRVRLEGSPKAIGKGAISFDNAQHIQNLFTSFFMWEPDVPKNSKQLAEFLAPLCRMLRDDVLEALTKNVAAVQSAAADWRRYLFPGADDRRFADAYAQTVTFSLLLARSNGSDTLFLDEAIASLTHANTLLSRALKVLTDPLVKDHLSASLGMLQRVIDRVPTGTMSGGRRDPWLHFYEDFLSEYDPKLRQDAGAYYTPVEVVQAQVRLVDNLLREKLGKKHGFATGGVNVLDPAVGTGTYLLGVIEHVMAEVQKTEGRGAMPARADLLGAHLYGFEIMVGPYAVAALRLTRMLHQYGGHPPADGVQVMLNNTLESPYEKIPDLPLLYQPIGLEHKRAKRVKETVPVLVCLGNPPYDRHEAATALNRATTGGWIRWGDLLGGEDAILNDFIKPVRDRGKGHTLKNLYNLYVYFWRWALWKTFENDLAIGPGIITYITASSFLDGEAFLGMRKHMRKVCDEIWIIDLGGEGRGTRQDENVFAIKTPVTIAIAVRYNGPQPTIPARAHYIRIEGTRAEKLGRLEQLNRLDDLAFEDCPSEWEAPFRPAGAGSYFDWPLLTDLMPWQSSGAQIKRRWPIDPDPQVLVERWKALLNETDRSMAFKETRDRKVNSKVQSLDNTTQHPSLKDIAVGTMAPSAQPYGYRSFDRQHLLLDNRLGDFLRPLLWNAHSDSQIYFGSLLTKVLGSGPALTVSASVPDMDFFSGRGAKDILPLYRDKRATIPNLHPHLLRLLESAYGKRVSPNDFAAYIYAILAHPGFTHRHHEELASKTLRVPLTADATLFDRAVLIGRELVFLHTYGERFAEGQSWPPPSIKNLKSVISTPLPEQFRFDEERQTLIVGEGEFGPVSLGVYNYEISGLKVVQSWLGYRLRKRRGRKSSELDNITSPSWPAEHTSELLRLLNLLTRTLEIEATQASLLEDVEVGPLLNSNAFAQLKKSAGKKRAKVATTELDL